MSGHRTRDERITQAHADATAPGRWFCRVPGCPIVDVVQHAGTYGAALEAADAHYNAKHYEPAWTPPPGFAEARRAFLTRSA